ncbi:MAG: hypothetical protein IJV50_05415 [Lachnospiraceae bacterium]|nr:hypothetical protein [Lachnospiraceae bacterium]
MAVDQEVKETGVSTERTIGTDNQIEETMLEVPSVEQEYYEIQLEAEPLDKETVAEAVFGTKVYEKEDSDGSWVYLADESTGIIFYTDTYFTYAKSLYHVRYNALVSSPWGAVMLQDMRLESLFPKEELDNGGKQEAEQVCDQIMDAIGYQYDEKRIYTIDSDLGNLMAVPAPSQTDFYNSYDNLVPWESDEGAYLLVYRNKKLVDVQEEMAFADMQTMCYMIYSPKYGLCYINMEPVFHEVSRKTVDVIAEEEARKQTVALFQLYGIPYHLVEVTGYDLVYCENFYSVNSEMTASSVIPCWKISFRPKESQEVLWQAENSIARGDSALEAYVVLDARVGGSINTFYPSPDF